MDRYLHSMSESSYQARHTTKDEDLISSMGVEASWVDSSALLIKGLFNLPKYGILP